MNIVEPDQYLRAGLPVPWSRVAVTAADDDEAVRLAAEHVRAALRGEELGIARRTRTVVGEDGRPIVVTFVCERRPDRWDDTYLIHTGGASYIRPGELEFTERLDNGILHVRRKDGATTFPHQIIPSVSPFEGRPVTVDLSVLLAGHDPSYFQPDDLLFMSTATALDLAGFVWSEEKPDGRIQRSLPGPPWDISLLVPVDTGVLGVFRDLVSALAPFPGKHTDLYRTDLVCAATAIHYGAPLYTTKPEAYKGLKNGLKVIRYGPRPKRPRPTAAPPPEPTSAQADSPATSLQQPPPAAPPDSSNPAARLRERYEGGEPFDRHARALLGAALATDAAALGMEVLEILRDRGNADPSWRTSLMRLADLLAPAIATLTVNEHADLLSEGVLAAIERPPYVASDGPLRQEHDAAHEAMVAWGRWPEDVEGLLGELVDFGPPAPDFVAQWYPTLMRMAGVVEEDIEPVMAEVTAGRVTPSPEHILSLLD